MAEQVPAGSESREAGKRKPVLVRAPEATLLPGFSGLQLVATAMAEIVRWAQKCRCGTEFRGGILFPLPLPSDSDPPNPSKFSSVLSHEDFPKESHHSQLFSLISQSTVT